MKYFYINKKYIVYFLILFFIIVNLTQIYGYSTTFREGAGGKDLKKIGKKTGKALGKVGKSVGGALVDVTNKAVSAAEKISGDLLDNLNVQNALKKIIEPIINLKKAVNDALDILRNF
jgi:hypothetical protein